MVDCNMLDCIVMNLWVTIGTILNDYAMYSMDVLVIQIILWCE
jgi:hypothetical protein